MKTDSHMTGVLWMLDTDGRTPIPSPDPVTWTEFMFNEQARQIGVDCDDAKEVFVSTIFLGVGDRHHLFQTVIFGGPYDDREKHYPTWEEAEAGHAVACELAGIQRKES